MRSCSRISVGATYSIPTAVFTFLLPADPATGALATTTDPVFADPGGPTNTLANRNGSWTVLQVSPEVYNTLTGNPISDLEGYTVYQASLDGVINQANDNPVA